MSSWLCTRLNASSRAARVRGGITTSANVRCVATLSTALRPPIRPAMKSRIGEDIGLTFLEVVPVIHRYEKNAGEIRLSGLLLTSQRPENCGFREWRHQPISCLIGVHTVRREIRA